MNPPRPMQRRRPTCVTLRAAPPAHRAPAPVPAPRLRVSPAQPLSCAPGSRLHIGCGAKRLPGWINADAARGVGETVVDLHAPQLPAETFATIYGSHVLEHCWPAETPQILGALFAALQPGGTLRLSVPDLRLVVAHCVDSNVYGGEASALSVLFGGEFSRETAGPDLHRQAFWRERLERLLIEAGFVRVRAWGFGQYPEIDALRDFATWPRDAQGRSTISLNLEADKPGAANASTGAPVGVSVLLGTVDRPQMLRECIDSVRSSLAGSGLTHEIVVAYGRPDEPSLPWMLEQPDVVPILGGMEGAIEAFNRAYAASRGELVCVINDDVLIEGSAIAHAARYLADAPTCAGVVFKFKLRTASKGPAPNRLNRRLGIPTKAKDGEHKHQRYGAALHPNQMIARRSTCEAVAERIGGLWGDAAHRTDKTYGGDTAFGAICHHLGLRLDSVHGVTCIDRCAEADDALRAANAQVAPDHWERFNARYRSLASTRATPGADEWPSLYAPRAGMAPRRSPVEAGRPLRLLHLSLRDASEPLVDMRRAFAQMGPTAEMPWHGRESEVLELARAAKPEVIFAQIQSDTWRPGMTEALRKAVGPACTFVLWTGDVRTSAAQPVERWLARAGSEWDLVLADSVTYPRKLALDEGATAKCGYLGCGIDPALNPWPGDPVEDRAAVFLGTNYRTLDGGARERLLSEVAASLPGKLLIFGRGWEGSSLGSISLPFKEQATASRIMRAAAVTISTSLFHDLERYTSDRLKRAMASGAVVAVRRFPDMEGLGLRDGENCLAWSTSGELVALLSGELRPERRVERAAMRARAAELARARFTWNIVTEELLAIVRDFRARKGIA